MSQPPSLDRRSYQIPHSETNFFKIIDGGIIEHQELELPKEFVMKHGKELSSMVEVEVPNGNSWNIKVRKADGVCFFSENGWNDFVDHHSIDVGHVILFSYHGKSQFSAIICTEISYPPKAPNTETCLETGFLLPHTTEIGEASCASGEEELTPYWGPLAVARNHSLVSSSSAVQAGRGYKSKNPSFGLIMQPAYVENRYALNVPLEFVIEHLGTENRKVNFQLPHSAQPVWKARYCYYETMAKFYGWKDFATENRLVVNDACVFELIDKKTITFAVTIFKNNQTYAVPEVDVYSEKQPVVHKKAKIEREYSFASTHRYFVIKLAGSYVHHDFLHVPAVFRPYLPKNPKTATIVDSKGGRWEVKYNPNGWNSRITEGWRSVVKSCGLKEGSVIAIELINDEDLKLKISILN